MIESLETSENNCQVAWDLLVERYDNMRIIIQNHVRELFELQAVGKESAVGLRNLLDKALRHVRALEALKQPTEFWNTPLVYLITSKLDKETRKEWERTTASNTMPKFDELTTFLNKKCQILELLNLPVCDQTKVNVKSGNKVSSTQDNGQSSKAFINTQTNISCIVCSESHFSNSCPEFLKLAANERMLLAKKKGLCFNCLRRNHVISEFKSRNCTICYRRHHTLLHNNVKDQSSSEEEKGKNKNQIKNLHVSHASKVLLSTTIVDLINDKGKKRACRILLDSGSQPNLITEKLANSLNLTRTKLDSCIEVVNNVEIASSEWVAASLHSRSSSFSTELSFLVLPHITGHIPSHPINKHSLKIPRHIKLSDPNFDQPAEIDALVGAELFYEIIGSAKIPLALPRTAF